MSSIPDLKRMLRSVTMLALATTSLVASAAMAQTGREQFHFLQFCAGCHLVDGSGVPPEVPNLRIDLGNLLDTPKGRDFILRVPGVVGVPIAVDEVADLMNWIITTYYPERSGFKPFTVPEIEAGRANPLYDPLKYRAEHFPNLYQQLSP
ncbi:MAG: hypothetical protein R3F50_07840 [Gammaproteobacteria bacterium]|jgi:hypothetical protein